MRTNVNLEMRCSKCDEVLEASSAKSKFTASSAYELRGIIIIKPCKKCYFLISKPLKLMKEAFKILGNEDDN